MSIRAVLWDYGHTLETHDGVDWNAVECSFLERLHRELLECGVDLGGMDRDDFRDRLQEAWRRWNKSLPEHYREVQIAELTATVLGIQRPGPALLEHLWECVDKACRGEPAMVPFPDTMETLHRAKASGLIQAVVSNTSLTRRALSYFLERQGFLAHLDGVISSTDHGYVKPHPSIFHAALELLGLGVDEAVFVGDNLYADIQGAQGVGMRAIWMRNGDPYNLPEHVKPDAICDTRADALDTVLRWREIA